MCPAPSSNYSPALFDAEALPAADQIISPTPIRPIKLHHPLQRLKLAPG